ncbi:MAG: ATP-binding cassette domain-containing protein [Devosia sp.]
MSVLAYKRWLAPEVIQTSSMDCGPAALKCMLEGFRIPVSYGRLREACQTSVDGTSIDTLEEVASRLGLAATQSLLPVDHLFLNGSRTDPAIVVTRQADGATHFVVVWKQTGRWLQVMDPGVGRRWVKAADFARSLFRHQASVAAQDWRDWAGSEAFLQPLRLRLEQLDLGPGETAALLDPVLAEDGWFPLAALDASTRFVTSLKSAGGLSKGNETGRLVAALVEQTTRMPDDIYSLVPAEYWSVAPDSESIALGERRVRFAGAVLVSAHGRRDGWEDFDTDLEPELAAARTAPTIRPLRTLASMLLTDGILAPAAIGGSILLASISMLVETSLLRGLVELGPWLAPGAQRLSASAALVTFMLLAVAVRLGIVAEALRLGRVLELKLRMALLDKLPRLSDRYFQSRPISDMADRGHSLHMSRAVPGIGIHFVQTAVELLLMLGAVLLLDWQTGLFATILAAVQIAVATAMQPLVGETDLRVRTHAAALHGIYLDALLGAVPIRVHRAQRPVRRQHERLLVEWVRAMRRQTALTISLDTIQQIVTMSLIALLLAEHFWRAAGVGPQDLLLVYWLMKLPVAGGALAGLAHQYPAQRNVLLRLLEPLGAPETARSSAPGAARVRDTSPARIDIEQGAVLAGGHAVLTNIDLHIEPGEHVAIVGPSGAGKSSLVGLLLGWHRLTEGSLLVDGMPLDGDRLDALRRQTAWVDPAVQLWNSSLSDNIEYTNAEATAERISASVGRAELAGLLDRLPDGLRTVLGESGSRLSGGEGQRVRLARAFAQDKVRIALLDEPFRGTDRAQRLALLNAARAQWSAATLLCVTHDIAETSDFPRVLVIENGQIVEDGPPRQLVQAPSRYRDLLSAEQLARQSLWQGTQWRELHMENGIVRSQF